MSIPEAQSLPTHWNLTALFWLSLAFLCGIVLGSALMLPVMNWSLLGIASLAIIALSLTVRRFLSRVSASHMSRNIIFIEFLTPIWGKIASLFSMIHIPVHPAFLLAFIVLGVARYQISQPVLSPESLAFYNDSGHANIIEGVIVKSPDYQDLQTNLVIQVDRLRPTYDLKFTNVSGRLLAKVSPIENWHYGDRIRLVGELRTPPEGEDFSYRDTLAGRGIYSLIESPQTTLVGRGMGNPILIAAGTMRERAYDTIFQLFPDPEASLFAGILLGMEGSITAQVKDAFTRTGTSHIIAISGFNIAVLSALLALLFTRLLGRWRAVIATVIGIAFYTLLVGAEPSVVRAAIMGSLSLFAIQLGRRQVGLNSLAIVAALMALANPLLLWHLSFQLSFSATLGIIIFADMFSEAFQRYAARWLPQATLQRIAAPVSEFLLITLAAQVFTLPIIAYHFSRISLVSLSANPVILPAQPPLMILGGIATILGSIFLPLGKIVAAIAWPFALYTIRMVEFFARIPKGEILLGDVSLWLVILFYAAVFALTFAFGKVKDIMTRIKPAIPLAGLFILTVLVWQMASAQPDARLHLTLLNVSTQGRNGHAILIDTPTGRRILINGGPRTSLLSDALGRRFPWINHQLDWLVVAANSEDELAALPRTIERYPPEHVLWAGVTHGNATSRNLWEELILLRTPVTRAEAGHALELGDGAWLRVLTVCPRGAVLLLEWQNFRALLPLGLDLDDIEGTKNGGEIGPLNVLLLAESGYAPVNPPEWIANLNPQLILLSVAAGNFQGLPSPETLQAIQDYEVLRTDVNGWIELSTDGENLWVEVERK